MMWGGVIDLDVIGQVSFDMSFWWGFYGDEDVIFGTLKDVLQNGKC